jgi:hypothetical protein
MKVVILPNGVRVDLQGGSYILEDDQTLVFDTKTGLEYRFVPTYPNEGNVLLQAIDAFVATSDNISANPVSTGGVLPAITLTSVSPNPIPTNTITDLTFTGTSLTDNFGMLVAQYGSTAQGVTIPLTFVDEVTVAANGSFFDTTNTTKYPNGIVGTSVFDYVTNSQTITGMITLTFS